MKKKESAEVLEFAIDSEDYRRFERFASANRVTRDEALRAVLIEGMSRYWPQQLADMETDYPRLKERFEEYSRDNDVLRNIYTQNNELKKLLEKSKSKEKVE